MDQYEALRSKPLVQLLRIAEVKGVISGWSLEGPSLVLHRGEAHVLVQVVDASELLIRWLSEAEDDAVP